MQPSIPYEGALLSAMEDGGKGGGEGYSHTIGVLYVNTLHRNSAPNLPHPFLPLLLVGRIQGRRGKCLRMLHSILCALNRRQSTTQVRLSEGDGCILVPSREGWAGYCSSGTGTRDLWQMGSIDAQYYRPEYVVLRSFYAIEIESAAIEGGLNVRRER